MSSRPLSPHLQIYRPQLTSTLSITHRATGIVLSLGAVVLTYWLLALAGGETSYAAARGLLGSLPGLLALAAWAFSFYYHLCNGVRHLFWDIGVGFELKSVYASGYTVIGVSVVLTLATIGYALSQGGA
tara:strand:- start:596 stop:982 length:387 start_codon:yes stop_codon:yes gene_type:complete